MKILLIYYTGTYNTRYLTGELTKKLIEKGNAVDTVEINAAAPVANTDGYDMIGF